MAVAWATMGRSEERLAAIPRTCQGILHVTTETWQRSELGVVWKGEKKKLSHLFYVCFRSQSRKQFAIDKNQNL